MEAVARLGRCGRPGQEQALVRAWYELRRNSSTRPWNGSPVAVGAAVAEAAGAAPLAESIVCRSGLLSRNFRTQRMELTQFIRLSQRADGDDTDRVRNTKILRLTALENKEANTGRRAQENRQAKGSSKR